METLSAKKKMEEGVEKRNERAVQDEVYDEIMGNKTKSIKIGCTSEAVALKRIGALTQNTSITKLEYEDLGTSYLAVILAVPRCAIRTLNIHCYASYSQSLDAALRLNKSLRSVDIHMEPTKAPGFGRFIGSPECRWHRLTVRLPSNFSLDPARCILKGVEENRSLRVFYPRFEYTLEQGDKLREKNKTLEQIISPGADSSVRYNRKDVNLHITLAMIFWDVFPAYLVVDIVNWASAFSSKETELEWRMNRFDVHYYFEFFDGRNKQQKVDVVQRIINTKREAVEREAEF